MPAMKLIRSILVSLFIFGCVLGLVRGTPGLAGTVKPYLVAVLTESTDLSRLALTARDTVSGLLGGERVKFRADETSESETEKQRESPESPQETQETPQTQWEPSDEDGEQEGSPGKTQPEDPPADAAGAAAKLPAYEPRALLSRGRIEDGEEARAATADSFRPVVQAPVSGRVTFGYGYRMHPIYRRRLFHRGIDIAASKGTPIRAAAAGKVTRAGTFGTYGRIVEINHGRGIVTLYAHCSKIHVRPGDLVKEGQKIAEVGSTGLSTGPHLHFEVSVNGSAKDPFAYLEGGRRDVL